MLRNIVELLSVYLCIYKIKVRSLVDLQTFKEAMLAPDSTVQAYTDKATIQTNEGPCCNVVHP